jgi:hypothetical protein
MVMNFEPPVDWGALKVLINGEIVSARGFDDDAMYACLTHFSSQFLCSPCNCSLLLPCQLHPIRGALPPFVARALLFRRSAAHLRSLDTAAAAAEPAPGQHSDGRRGQWRGSQSACKQPDSAAGVVHASLPCHVCMQTVESTVASDLISQL